MQGPHPVYPWGNGRAQNDTSSRSSCEVTDRAIGPKAKAGLIAVASASPIPTALTILNLRSIAFSLCQTAARQPLNPSTIYNIH
jgi:hypothetical protein